MPSVAWISTAHMCRFRQNTVIGWFLMMRSLNWISAKSLINAQRELEIWLRSNEGIL